MADLREEPGKRHGSTVDRNAYPPRRASRAMATNPVERSLLARFLVGVAVVAAMTLVGGGLGTLLLSARVPYGDWIGVGVGAVATFAAFSAAYVRYDAGFDGS
jgi:opacity protein-like surface antigen